jgi:hypothetical protein
MERNDNGIIDLQIQLAKFAASLNTMMQVNEQQHLMITQRLDNILEQTKRTNGRVTKLEEWKESLNTELIEYRFAKRYPKIALGAIVVTAAIALLNLYILIVKAL